MLITICTSPSLVGSSRGTWGPTCGPDRSLDLTHLTSTQWLATPGASRKGMQEHVPSVNQAVNIYLNIPRGFPLMQPPLYLYRAILRAARSMPTTDRRRFVEVRARQGFEEARDLTAVEEIKQQFVLGEFQLDTVREQATHLTQLLKQGHFKNP
jgi:hypothetical protein